MPLAPSTPPQPPLHIQRRAAVRLQTHVTRNRSPAGPLLPSFHPRSCRITRRASNLHLQQHSSSMVPARPLGSTSGNRASDGGALESNGIIVGNKNEFKEVGLSERNALCASQPLTRSNSTLNGARTAWTTATLSWWAAESLWSRYCFHRVVASAALTRGVRNQAGASWALRKACRTRFARTTSFTTRGTQARALERNHRLTHICIHRGDVSRADFTVRASLATGRFSDGWGSCDRYFNLYRRLQLRRLPKKRALQTHYECLVLNPCVQEGAAAVDQPQPHHPVNGRDAR